MGVDRAAATAAEASLVHHPEAPVAVEARLVAACPAAAVADSAVAAGSLEPAGAAAAAVRLVVAALAAVEVVAHAAAAVQGAEEADGKPRQEQFACPRLGD